MGVVDGIAKFAIKKNLPKWAKGAGTAIVSYGAPLLVQHLGITLTPEQEIAIVASIGALILGGSNLLKHKFPAQFGWL